MFSKLPKLTFTDVAPRLQKQRIFMPHSGNMVTMATKVFMCTTANTGWLYNTDVSTLTGWNVSQEESFLHVISAICSWIFILFCISRPHLTPKLGQLPCSVLSTERVFCGLHWWLDSFWYVKHFQKYGIKCPKIVFHDWLQLGVLRSLTFDLIMQNCAVSGTYKPCFLKVEVVLFHMIPNSFGALMTWGNSKTKPLFESQPPD